MVSWGDEIEIRQGVEIGRPSVLYARATGSSEAIEGVEVGGSAVVVAQGIYLVRSARRS
jgi:trans-2,3-dihydro-3-hydroxyanthranilate isomerase